MSATPERRKGPVTEPVTATVTDDADQLRALVSAMLSGTYKEEFYLWDVASLCRAKPEFARQLLTLIDRYHRLGQMPTAQHRKIKEKIERSSMTTAAANAASAAVTSPPLEPAGPNVTAPLPFTAASVAGDVAPPSAESVTNAVPTTATANAIRAAIPAAIPAPAAPAAAATAAAHPTTDSAFALTIGPGTVLRNRYELQTLLGCGGMGSVYKALDRYRASLGLPDCCLALKIVTMQLSRAGNLAALGREFHNAQQLSHPNVINVYEIDHEGDASFYTMELLDGERLSQLVERTSVPLPTRYALAIIRDIGHAIAHAHARSVVHADLKPHNIFVTYGGQVRVLDFGGLSLTPREPWIADLTPGTRSSSSSSRYRTATPAYASCEQLDGQRADARDDIYALACIAYELLAGRHPFDGKSSTGARAQHLHPRRPPGLPAQRWRALRRGLALDREQRPKQIEPWLEQIGVAAAAEHLPPTHQLMAGRPPRRWIGRPAAAAVLLLSLGAAVFALEQHADVDWHQTLAAAQSTLQSDWQQLQSSVDLTTPAAVSAARVPEPAQDSGAAPFGAAAQAAAAAPAAADGALTAGAGGSTALAHTAAPVRARPRAPSAQSSDAAGAHAGAAATRAPEAAADDSASDSPLPGDSASGASSTPIGVKFASLTYTVADAAPAARLVIRRSGKSRDEIPFVWWTQEDSAKADVDFAPLGRRTEHIPSGANDITIYVPIISNPLRHQTAKFYVALGVPGAADSAVPSARATVTIQRGG